MMNRSALLLSLLISTMMMTMVSSFAIIGGTKSVSFRHSLAGSVNLLGHSQRSSLNKLTILSLSEENPEQQKAVASTKSTGDVYDDEVDTSPQKEGISETMRERLLREATTGLDSERPQTNVLLYIILGVAVLVILGGQGLFY